MSEQVEEIRKYNRHQDIVYGTHQVVIAIFGECRQGLDDWWIGKDRKVKLKN